MLDPNPIISAPILKAQPDSHGLDRRILVVEDDVDLCMLIRQAIQEMEGDLHVQFASTVHEAAMWLDGSQPFDLVLADFLLADSRSGYELRAICQDRCPDALFAMMSAMPLQLPDISKSEFLQKPFSQTELREFIGSTFENAMVCQGAA